MVDWGFDLFMLLFVALLSRILTLVENPGIDSVLLLFMEFLMIGFDLVDFG